MTKLICVVFILVGAGLADSHAFVRSTSGNGVPAYWRGAEAPLNILVGCPGPVTSCFERAALDAAEAWNAAGAQFTFRFGAPTPGIPVACAEQPVNINGLVTVFWSSQQNCSPPLGPDIIALTHFWTAGDGHIGDADVEFNDINFRWAVYDGPARPVYDFRRTALHELGHVVGLDHPNDHGQHVAAVMNSASWDLDRLQADDIAGIRAIYPPQVAVSKGALENPGPNASKTGIGFVSGWVCDADKVEIVLAGWRASVAYKLIREDTRSVCGDADNGFMVLVNWNLLGDGPHRVRLFADGHELVSRAVTVTTFGTEFLTGRDGDWWVISDWPTPGTEIAIRWTEALQNIEIVDIQRK